MNIAPFSIEQDGPGIDLSEQPEGIAIEMSDPVADFEYARNAVTLTFDLSAFETVRLAFAAMEYGDEPHAPPAAPFGDAVNFDGVAVSVDGVDWYEIQDLRSLRSDRFTAYDIDLNAAIASLGLSYSSEFRIRFCQYDNNPSPKDGFFIQGIALTGDTMPPVLHLTMDDNAATATVADASAGAQDQTLSDPGGDPNTDAHTAPGQLGAALSFDGVDDFIALTEASHKYLLEADRDFAIAFWWKTNAPDPARTLYFLCNRNNAENSIFAYTANGDLTQAFRFAGDTARWVSKKWTGGADDSWHHYVFMREGTVLSVYRDAVSGIVDDHIDNSLSLAPSDKVLTLGSNTVGAEASPGLADDFRIYDRALLESELQALAATP